MDGLMDGHVNPKLCLEFSIAEPGGMASAFEVVDQPVEHRVGYVEELQLLYQCHVFYAVECFGEVHREQCNVFVMLYTSTVILCNRSIKAAVVEPVGRKAN